MFQSRRRGTVIAKGLKIVGSVTAEGLVEVNGLSPAGRSPALELRVGLLANGQRTPALSDLLRRK
jgi:hypothetical protein